MLLGQFGLDESPQTVLGHRVDQQSLLPALPWRGDMTLTYWFTSVCRSLWKHVCMKVSTHKPSKYLWMYKLIKVSENVKLVFIWTLISHLINKFSNEFSNMFDFFILTSFNSQFLVVQTTCHPAGLLFCLLIGWRTLETTKPSISLVSCQQ